MNDHVHATVDLTKNQSLVMGALTNSDGPLSAYTILDQLRDQRVSRAAPGLPGARQAGGVRACPSARKPQCLRRLPPSRLRRPRDLAFMICERCGQVNEITDNALAKRLKQLAGDASFALKKTTIELRGICHTCQVA
jgi:Fur family zinc uptake transcriptional regulator